MGRIFSRKFWFAVQGDSKVLASKYFTHTYSSIEVQTNEERIFSSFRTIFQDIGLHSFFFGPDISGNMVEYRIEDMTESKIRDGFKHIKTNFIADEPIIEAFRKIVILRKHFNLVISIFFSCQKLRK